MPKFEKINKKEHHQELFVKIGEKTTPDGQKKSIEVMVISCVGSVLMIGDAITFLPDVNIHEDNGVKKLVKERCWK